MKLRKLKVQYWVFTLFLMSSLNGCKKMLDVPSTRYSSEAQQWETVQDGKAGLLGMYSLLRTALSANNAHWLIGDMRNGDFVSYRRTDLNTLIKGNLNSSFSLLQDLSSWRRFYAAINAANVFIEKAPQILEHDPLYSEDNLKLDINQAKLVRAFAYFYMIRIWGDVPFMLQSHDNGKFSEKERVDQNVILDYLSNDILSFINTVPYQYGVNPVTYYDQNTGRWQGVLFNRISAYTLLAHIAAWQGDYGKVDTYTSFIMDNVSNIGTVNISSTANLVAGDGMFSRPRATHFIAFPYNDEYGEYSEEGHIEDLTLADPITTRPFPDLYLNKDSINSIFKEAGDQRHGVDTLSGEVKSQYFSVFNSEIPVFSKFTVFLASANEGNFNRYASTIVFSRYEEIILLRAEALAILRRPADAVTQLNRIRNQRGLPSFVFDVAEGNIEDLIKLIFDERRRELMGEGWRWYDQVRLNRQLRDNPAFNKLLDQGGIYWPIAAEVIDNNQKIKQNDYWDN